MENEVNDLSDLIAGCMKQDRKCQKLLYKSHYGFAVGICLRYVSNHYEAIGIMNKGFLNVFSDLQKYDSQKPFKSWLRRIMIHTSVDYYRGNLEELYMDNIENADVVYNHPLADSNLGYKELLAMVQQLPHWLRLVFNLYAIDGYTHKEIGKILGKSEETCKFLLLKAREILRQMIEKAD